MLALHYKPRVDAEEKFRTLRLGQIFTFKGQLYHHDRLGPSIIWEWGFIGPFSIIFICTSLHSTAIQDPTRFGVLTSISRKLWVQSHGIGAKSVASYGVEGRAWASLLCRSQWQPFYIFICQTFWSPGGPVLCTNVKLAGLHMRTWSASLLVISPWGTNM